VAVSGATMRQKIVVEGKAPFKTSNLMPAKEMIFAHYVDKT